MNTEEEVYCLGWRTHSVQHPVSTTGHKPTSKEEEKQGKYMISSLQHSHSFQLLSALGISWVWGGVHSLTLNTVLFQTLGPSSLNPRETPCTQHAIQKGTERRTISSCLDLCSHYRKSDGLYSKSQLASTLYKLLRMWGASCILPLWWQLQASIVPFKGHKDSRASLLFFSNSSIFFLRSRKRNREQCSWRKLTTDFWSAIDVFPVLFSVPFLEMCLAFSKHQHGIHAGHTYLKSHSWVVATNSGIPTFSVKLWLGFCTHITLHLSTPYLIYFFTA